MFVLIFSILSTILLIYLLYNTYITIRKQLDKKAKQKYEQLCPDYWEIVGQKFDDSGNPVSIECKNVHKLGKCAVTDRNTFIFEDEIFINPETADISKCKWAKQCSVSWQGYDSLCV
jgi:hypothetical protein